MAIYHFSTKPVRRGTGRTAVASAAYRSGSKVRDRARGVSPDYQHKAGVRASEMMLPSGTSPGRALDWARDRESLWNRAEAAEVRVNARVAREYEFALPHELTADQQLALARSFGQKLVDRYGVVGELCLHEPTPDGDPRNVHAHLLTTTRVLTNDELGGKSAIERSDRDRRAMGLGTGILEVRTLRDMWQAWANAWLKELGHEVRIDARSLEDQGVLDREPQRYKGPHVTALERQAVRDKGMERQRAPRQQEKPKPLTPEEKWLQRRDERTREAAAAEGRGSTPEERWLKRREERLSDPEGYHQQQWDPARRRDRDRGK